jgi:hypothetical protein
MDYWKEMFMSSVKNIVFLLLSIWVLVAPGSGVARTAENPQATEERNNSIKAALEKLGGGEAPSYKIGWFDLDGDGRQEAIVLMTGAEWCGTGGCTLMVLKRDAVSWRVVSRVPTCRSPVVLLDGKTHGWRDLAVVTQGGGDVRRNMTVLKVQKKGYVKHHEIAVEDGGQMIIP